MKIRDIRKRYPKDVDKVNELSMLDPSGTNKYVLWMIEQCYACQNYSFDMAFIKFQLLPLIKVYHEGLENKQIDTLINHGRYNLRAKEIKYFNWYSLNNLVNTLLEIKEKKEQENKVINVYEDDNVLVVIPLTKQASQKYGSSTRWCTTGEGNYFSSYSNHGILFYVILKKLLPYEDKLQTVVNNEGLYSLRGNSYEDFNYPRFKKIAFYYDMETNKFNVYDSRDSSISDWKYFYEQIYTDLKKPEGDSVSKGYWKEPFNLKINVSVSVLHHLLPFTRKWFPLEHESYVKQAPKGYESVMGSWLKAVNTIKRYDKSRIGLELRTYNSKKDRTFKDLGVVNLWTKNGTNKPS